MKAAGACRLPAQTRFGLPGKSAERLRIADFDAGETSSRAHRPNWAAQTFQPRIVSPFGRRGALRRSKGALVEPFYGVYPPDDRQVYYPSTYPWRCVGRIFTWTDTTQPNWAWSGSGVLVGPRHVVTAGHVVPWGSANWGMLFVPAYYDGASLYGAGSTSWVSDARGWNTDETVAANDMAVLRLYNADLGPALGWMGSKVFDTSWEGGDYWHLCGYPGMIAGANRPSWQGGIPVLDADASGGALEIEHHGDASPGDSGGPFFGFWNDGPHVVGTVSGGEANSQEDNNINAGGSDLVNLIQWAQSNWP